MANTRSSKAKGRRLQQEVRDRIREHFPSLEEDDITCTLMGESGCDIKLSPAAKKKFPFSIECKNQESLSIWAALKQAADNIKEGTTPLLVFRRNRSKTYVTLEFEDFMKLLPKDNEEKSA
jgi:hypothetical protein